jgi:hypothetical protein
MALIRLVYRSRATVDLDWKLISNLITVAQSHNHDDGITGLLFGGHGQFLQVLEGPSGKVNACFQRISRDKRHQEIELLSVGPAGDRLFTDWVMKGVHARFLGEFTDVLIRQFGDHQGYVQVPGHPDHALALLLALRAVENQAT